MRYGRSPFSKCSHHLSHFVCQLSEVADSGCVVGENGRFPMRLRQIKQRLRFVKIANEIGQIRNALTIGLSPNLLGRNHQHQPTIADEMIGLVYQGRIKLPTWKSNWFRGNGNSRFIKQQPRFRRSHGHRARLPIPINMMGGCGSIELYGKVSSLRRDGAVLSWSN